ncbi:hypothetical protein [Chroococcidiopsis sp. SAG 2025]|uniref:hypothetical protein n=1 Tax=Chroococcidiopsis sp. SAG 2025 TaxID=171389 RepID=UPI0029371900|nr:hypothetical protein [Chroococcidiopsis sp. SAG 2025]
MRKQLSVISGRRGGFSQQIHGFSHNLRSKPARTVISYQLSVISDRGVVANW